MRESKTFCEFKIAKKWEDAEVHTRKLYKQQVRPQHTHCISMPDVNMNDAQKPSFWEWTMY